MFALRVERNGPRGLRKDRAAASAIRIPATAMARKLKAASVKSEDAKTAARAYSKPDSMGGLDQLYHS